MIEGSAIRDFGGTHLNQDWDLDYGTWQEALDAWVFDSPRSLVPFIDELDVLLARDLTEAQLEAIVFPQLDLSYVATPEEGGYRGWLQALRDRAASRR